MNGLHNILTDPYPLQDRPKLMLGTNLMIGILAVVVVFVFKSHIGLEVISGPPHMSIAIYAGYGIVTFLIALAADRLVKPAFPTFFDEQTWTIARNIIWTILLIVLIGIGNYFYSNILDIRGISGTLMLNFVVNIIVLSFIPVTVITLINYFWRLNRNMKEAKIINEILSKQQVKGPGGNLFFNSENGKDELRLNTEHFLFAESSANYTDVVYIENGIVRRALIRSTLKRLESLNNIPYVIMVHRAFIANLKKVTKAISNAQGLRLIYDHVEETVPVSKIASAEVKNQLSALHPG
jgi:hypothetical protein